MNNAVLYIYSNTSEVTYNIFQPIYLFYGIQFLYEEYNVTHHQQLHQDNERQWLVLAYYHLVLSIQTANY